MRPDDEDDPFTIENFVGVPARNGAAGPRELAHTIIVWSMNREPSYTAEIHARIDSPAGVKYTNGTGAASRSHVPFDEVELFGPATIGNSRARHDFGLRAPADLRGLTVSARVKVNGRKLAEKTDELRKQPGTQEFR